MTQSNDKTVMQSVSTINPNFLIKNSTSSEIIHLLSPEKFLQTKLFFDFLMTKTEMMPLFLQDLLESSQTNNQLFSSNELEFVFLNHSYVGTALNHDIIQHINIIKKTLQNTSKEAKRDRLSTASSFNLGFTEIEKHPTIAELTEKSGFEFQNKPIDSTDSNVEKTNTGKFVTVIKSVEEPKDEDYFAQNDSSSADHVVTVDTTPIVKYLPLNLSLPNMVNLHRGPHADKITKLHKADAVTLGSEVFSANGKLDLFTPKGIALLVHELTHVHQNENLSGQPFLSFPDSALEERALGNERLALSIFEDHAYITTTDQKLLPNSDNSFVLSNNTETNSSTLNFIQTNFSQNSFPNNGHTILGNNPDLFFSDNYFAPNYSNITQKPTYLTNNAKPNLSYVIHPSIHSEKSTISTNVETNNNNRSLPLTAQTDRSTSTSSTAAQPVPSVPAVPPINIEMLTNQVYEKITQKIKLERDRVGYR